MAGAELDVSERNSKLSDIRCIVLPILAALTVGLAKKDWPVCIYCGYPALDHAFDGNNPAPGTIDGTGGFSFVDYFTLNPAKTTAVNIGIDTSASSPLFKDHYSHVLKGIELIRTGTLADKVSVAYALSSKPGIEVDAAGKYLLAVHLSGGDDVFSIRDLPLSAGQSGHRGAVVYGGDGEDRLTGGRLGDRLLGGDGDDELNGGGGGDILLGDAGADLIYGGGGNDLIHTGNGQDTVSGGAGGDSICLSRDFSKDTILFRSINDSRGLARDQILRFEGDYDKFDLSQIDADSVRRGDQAFSLVSDFSKHAGELQYDILNSPGQTTYRFTGDINGDGKADFNFDVINPTNARHTNIADWFVL